MSDQIDFTPFFMTSIQIIVIVFHIHTQIDEAVESGNPKSKNLN